MSGKFLLVALILACSVIPAHAKPYCPEGSECNDFVWNPSKAAFSCGYGTCKCGTKTYNCYMPCEDDRSCNTLVYDWESTCSDDCGTEMSGYFACTDNLLAGVCETEWQYSYRCARGFYGNPTASNQNDCVRCPTFGTIQGTTPDAGATQIGDCYLPSGSKLSDATGEYEFSEDCYY